MRFALLVLAACSGGGRSPLGNDAFVPGPPCGDQSCDPGDKCSWVVDRIDPPSGHRACAPAGNVGFEGACAYGIDGVGASNCVDGSECVDGVCRQICNFGLEAAAHCDNIHTACSYAADVLLGDNYYWYAGICQPTCNALTQERWDGAPACGSPDPTNPTFGCVPATPENDKFVCARLEAGASAGGSAAIVRNGSPDVTGCAAGYTTIGANGLHQATCMGICAPLPTDNTQPQNAIGDPDALAKLPASPTPRAGDGVCIDGKKGSSTPQDCRYLLNSVGVCFDYGKYGEPSCATLTPTQAAQHGCHPP